MNQSDFNSMVLDHLSGENEAVAVEALSDYLGSFRGRLFEQLADPDPFALTANDFVAVSALSVDIPPKAAALLLGELRPSITHHLRRIPAAAAITDGADLLAEDSDAWALYDLLRSVDGLGPTRVSKLLAAKRPALVPIRDSVVHVALGSPKEWWSPWVGFMTGPDATARLKQIRKVAVAARAQHLSLLRVLDVVIWMAHRPRRGAPDPLLNLSPEVRVHAERVLRVFADRGLAAGALINFWDFSGALTWKDGFLDDEHERLALVELVERGLVIEYEAGLELTELGASALPADG